MNNQRGMTLISWVLVLGLLAFFVTLTLRILPMYQEYYGVVNIMKGMENEITQNKLSKAQVRLLLHKRFNTGYISSVEDEHIEISRGRRLPHVTKIVIDYEVRVPFIAQIDLIGHFYQEVDTEQKIQ